VEQAPRPSPPISRLVRAGTALVVIAIVLSAAVALATVVTTSRTADVVIDRIGPLRTDNALLLRNLVDAETGLRGYQITTTDDVLQPYRSAEAAIPRLLGEMRGLAGGNEDWQQRIDQLADRIDEWFRTQGDAVIAGIAAGDPEATSDAMVEAGKAIVDDVRQINSRFDDELVAERERHNDQLDRLSLLAAIGIAVALLIAFVALVSRARRVGRAVTRPLQQLEAAVEQVEAGANRLGVDIHGAREVEHLATVIDDMAHRTATLAAANADRLLEERLVRHLTRRIREALGRDDVLERAAQVLGSAARADHVVVLAIADGRVGEVLVEWSRPGVEQFGRGERLPHQPGLDEAVAGLIAARETLVVDDVATSPDLSDAGRAFLLGIGVRAAVLAPAVAGDDALALVAVLAARSEEPWTPLAATATSAVADDLATALTHARLYEREQEMVERLRGLDQAKTDFVSSVSHELRTPLTSIRGFVEMLRDGEGGELQAEQDHMLAIVERNSDRLLALIEDLLTLSRVESGTFRTTMTSLDLCDLARSALEGLEPQASARSIRLTLDAVDTVPAVRGDATQLERVLLNLLTNAIKFSDDGAQVTVRIRVDDGVVIEVADEGMGIPEAEQAELFTRFFRSSTAQDRAIPGTGLGLVIVQSIVEHHGGTVSVTSAPGIGTTVRIHLPAAEPAIVSS
jgi:signal transduction histidine kinase/CHASE3 domain sensor protein